jgi:cytochrome c biogenesis protein CcmG/thiol:disulfide interchange protein DsbE
VAEDPSSPVRSSRRWIVASFAGVAVLAATWAIVAGRSDGASRADAIVPGTPIAVDRAAPGFTAPVLGGSRSLSLESFRGSVVVVNFWASWCHACRAEASSLRRLARSFEGDGVRFVGIDYEDRGGAAMAAAHSFALPYPSVADPDASVGDAFGIMGLPTTYVIDASGRIRYEVPGRLDPASLRTALRAVVAGGAST